jgi:hypothetical protein
MTDAETREHRVSEEIKGRWVLICAGQHCFPDLGKAGRAGNVKREEFVIPN